MSERIRSSSWLMEFTTSSIFRYIVVKFADRGLTQKGHLNLQLMNLLGWVCYSTNVALPVFTYFSQVFNPDFPGKNVHVYGTDSFNASIYVE